MMSVTSVGNSLPVTPAVAPLPQIVTPQTAAIKKITSFQPSASGRSDPLTLEPAPKAMYTKADLTERKPSAQDMALSRMAERIITKQYSEGNQFYKLLYGHIALRLDPTLRSSEPMREALLERAREAVGTDGPFSAENTAVQIVQFVQREAAGDQAKTERFRAAVQEAFAKLAVMSGGQMPELTQKTYDAVMQGLGEPASAAQADG